MWRGRRFLNHPGLRHSPDWYDQSEEADVLEPGDRMFIRSEGGPCNCCLEMFPPRLEIPERDGLYVLRDIGQRDEWRYDFVPQRT